MSDPQPTSRPAANGRRRVLRWVIPGVVLVLVALSVAMFPRDGRSDLSHLPTTPVQRGPLLISVIESGTIRPREQIILKNELEQDAKILFIVPEGAQVKKGDLLCELDVTEQTSRLLERRIRVQSAESNVVFADENLKIAENQGQADIEAAALLYDFAQRDLKQYLEGEYKKLLLEAETKIQIAHEKVERAVEKYNWSQKLFNEKYLSETELKADKLAADESRLSLQLAEADLNLLKEYTYPRKLVELEANVKQSEMALERTKRKVAAARAQAEAELKANKAMLEDEAGDMRELEVEVSKAKMYAPIDGMVLYASSVADEWDDDDPRIDEGAIVSERGEIIYLPTADAYNVDVKIVEVNLRKIRTGLPVRITVDAMPGKTFTGRVEKIAPLPDASSRFMNPNLKVYNTTIGLDNPDPMLRNGMSCRIEIFVQRYDDVLAVPVQAVTRVNGTPTVYVIENGQVVPRRIEIGLDNTRMVHVLEGLEGDEVVLLDPPLSKSQAVDDPEDQPSDAEKAAMNGEAPKAPEQRRERRGGGEGTDASGATGPAAASAADSTPSTRPSSSASSGGGGRRSSSGGGGGGGRSRGNDRGGDREREQSNTREPLPPLKTPSKARSTIGESMLQRSPLSPSSSSSTSGSSSTSDSKDAKTSSSSTGGTSSGDRSRDNNGGNSSGRDGSGSGGGRNRN
jgi:HlyD family secretion protein